MKPIILRPATPADLPFIRRFHAEQNKRDGTSYPIPAFFDGDGKLTDRAPVVLVGCIEGTDEPVQALWVERRMELMFAGCDNPKATAFAQRDSEALAGILSWLGYSGLYCDVPIALAEAIGKPLVRAGFKRNDDRLAHFYKDLREKR